MFKILVLIIDSAGQVSLHVSVSVAVLFCFADPACDWFSHSNIKLAYLDFIIQ